VSSLIQISTRSAKINKPIGADKGQLLGMNWVCLRILCVCQFRANIFFIIYLLTYNCQTSNMITLSELKDKMTSSTPKS